MNVCTLEEYFKCLKKLEGKQHLFIGMHHISRSGIFLSVKFKLYFLPINKNMCLGAQENRLFETVLYEYQQHIFWMRNEENNFQVRTLVLRPDAYTYKSTDSIVRKCW